MKLLKKIVPRLVLGVFLTTAAVLTPPLFLTGCVSTQTAAYKTLAATEATVDAALQAFADLRVHGKVDDATYAKVDGIYKQYQAAFASAITVAKLNPSALTPADVAALAAQLTATINAIVK